MENTFVIHVANRSHLYFAVAICEEIADSARQRGTGISRRTPVDITAKMTAGKAIIALYNDNWAGFCYIESWSNNQFVSNSGLIVAPAYRNMGLATALKAKAVELAASKFPEAKVFGLTTSAAVMKINSQLGFDPVVYSELPQDETFWSGCRSCVNHSILLLKERKNCLCTAMLLPSKIEAIAGRSSQNTPVLYEQ